MSTVYRLAELDYKIYVIADNVMELPAEDTSEVSRITLGTVLPKMNVNVISIEQALKALEAS